MKKCQWCLEESNVLHDGVDNICRKCFDKCFYEQTIIHNNIKEGDEDENIKKIQGELR